MLNQEIDLVNMNFNGTINKTHPIRVIHVDDIQNNLAQFYERYAHEPVIIKGISENSPFLQNLTHEEVERLLRGQNLYALEQKSYKRVLLSGNELFDGFRKGVTSYNIFHTLDDTPLADKFEIPSFLQLNWFVDSGFDTNDRALGIMYSPKGTFTSMHTDFYGAQAWMYVAYGKKVWECYPPQYSNILFDSLFNKYYNTRQDSPEQFPLAHLAEKFVGTIEAGDLIFVPAGWPHEVETLEQTFAISGVIVNDFQIEDSMRSWLWDRALYVPGELDLKQLILNLPPERISGEAGHKRIQAALNLCTEWEAHTLRRWFTRPSK